MIEPTAAASDNRPSVVAVVAIVFHTQTHADLSSEQSKNQF